MKFKLNQIVIATILLISIGSIINAQTSDEVRDLLPNQNIEREMTGKATHQYKFDLKKDEFFQVRVEQKGVDVALKLSDGKGNVLAEMDSPNGKEGFETLTFVANTNGGFILEVISPNQKAEKGIYIISRVASRTATEKDKRRVEVEKVFVEGIKASKTEGQKEFAVSKLKEALIVWEELKDDYLIRLTAQNIGLLKNCQAEFSSKNKEPKEVSVLCNQAEIYFKKGGDIGQAALTAFYAFNAEILDAYNLTGKGKKLLYERKNESVLKARSIFKEVLETQYKLSRKWNEVFEKIDKAKESLKLSFETVAELNEINRDGAKFRENGALQDVALTHYFFGEFEEELNYRKLALTALREGRAGKSKEASSLFRKYDEASNLDGIGLSLGNLKRYQESIEFRQQALQIYRELEKELPQFIIELKEAGLDKILNVSSGIQSLRFQQGVILQLIGQLWVSSHNRGESPIDFSTIS